MKLLLIILSIVLTGWLSYISIQGFNTGLNIAIQELRSELKTEIDSINFIEANQEELFRIQQLSFTRPVTPEHVKGVQLDSLNMRLMRLNNWLRLKKAEVKAKEKMVAELSSYYLNLNSIIK